MSLSWLLSLSCYSTEKLKLEMFPRLYCWYGNLLSQEKRHNSYTNECCMFGATVRDVCHKCRQLQKWQIWRIFAMSFDNIGGIREFNANKLV